ncbi:MAG: aminotransferase class I/II-fold pyridoxal phosphate-dependent enzyme [Rhodobacteraceae bacterium]|nr:aminotransferase class I/II-fold pyridoxal phosphate-dependent enzyme [Paracoccaceae bacterium]
MPNSTSLHFLIDRSLAAPLFEQICAGLRARIISASLPEGAILPPTRALANELGVSRSTVVSAYEQLVAEGYLNGVQGSGYAVLSIGEVELSQRTQTKPRPQIRPAHTPMRPFQAGQPDMRLFPHRQWAQTIARVCRTQPEALLLANDSFGNLDLRISIAAHVQEWRGISATPAQVIITAGSTDAIEICFRALAKHGEPIGLENPGYLPLRRVAENQGLSVENLEIDSNGATLPSSARDIGMVVLTPSQQYPLGGAMPPARRHAFLQWAEKHNVWIVEDDYDSEFRYAGSPIPAMAGIDQLNRTLYVGSFSKIFSNSLRLGYIIAPENLVGRFRDNLHTFGTKASALPQQALANFMQAGEFYRHLRRVRRIYGDRRAFLLGRLEQDFGQYGSFTDHQAGMQVAFHLHNDSPDSLIEERARKYGVTATALSGFQDGKTALNGLLLGFCGFSNEEMSDALSRLKKAIEA